MRSLIANHFEKNFDTLVKKVSGRAGGAYNAEDVVQEAYARALKYSDAFNEKYASFDTWFATILNNSLKDFKKDERHSGTFVELEEHHIFSDEDENYILALAERLSEEVEDQKGDVGQVLNMYFLLGYTRRDIRKVTELGRPLVDFYIKRFRDQMKEKYPEEDGSWRP